MLKGQTIVCTKQWYKSLKLQKQGIPISYSELDKQGHAVISKVLCPLSNTTAPLHELSHNSHCNHSSTTAAPHQYNFSSCTVYFEVLLLIMRQHGWVYVHYIYVGIDTLDYCIDKERGFPPKYIELFLVFVMKKLRLHVLLFFSLTLAI